MSLAERTKRTLVGKSLVSKAVLLTVSRVVPYRMRCHCFSARFISEIIHNFYNWSNWVELSRTFMLCAAFSLGRMFSMAAKSYGLMTVTSLSLLSYLSPDIFTIVTIFFIVLRQ